MTIKKINYEENKKITSSELDDYTRKIVPEIKHNYKDLSFIYEEEGNILGRIVGYVQWDYLKIELFYVSPQAQGKGIGSKLLHHIESIANSEKCRYILLETMSFNAPKFYKAHGFTIMAQIDNSPLEGETHYFMKKDLKS